MPIYSRHVTIAVALGLALGVGSCGNPNAPRPPTSPTSPTPVATIRVEIVVPPTIEPGAVVQLTANAIKADGSIENVTKVVHWTVRDAGILHLSAGGLATGRARGETVIRVSFDQIVGTALVYVLPNGTFAVRGIVTDSGFEVENAHVTVMSGVGAGLTTVTRSSGTFAFYGVAGPVQIEARRAGYRTSIQTLDVIAHRTLDFALETEQPRPDYNGRYRLTLSSEFCLTLPEDARTRVYTATVLQDIGHLTVTLSDADLIVTNGYGNRFIGFAQPDGSINFRIGHGYLYYSDYFGLFDIVERFGATAYMASGTVIATGTPQRISGPLDGTLHISSRVSAPFLPSNNECRSKTHVFEMVRQ